MAHVEIKIPEDIIKRATDSVKDACAEALENAIQEINRLTSKLESVEKVINEQAKSIDSLKKSKEQLRGMRICSKCEVPPKGCPKDKHPAQEDVHSGYDKIKKNIGKEKRDNVWEHVWEGAAYDDIEGNIKYIELELDGKGYDKENFLLGFAKGKKSRRKFRAAVNFLESIHGDNGKVKFTADRISWSDQRSCTTGYYYGMLGDVDISKIMISVHNCSHDDKLFTFKISKKR